MRIGRPQRWARDPRAGWFAVAGIGFAMCFAALVLYLASPVARPIDRMVSSWLWGYRVPWLTAVAMAFTFLAGSGVVGTLTAVSAIALAAAHRVRAALYVVFSVVPGWLLALALKAFLARPRPHGVAIVPLPSDFSMPSGHTTAAALLYGALAVVVIFNVDSSVARRLAVTVAPILALGVAVSRVYLGVHWFGDVVAALLFSAAWLSFTTVAYLGSVVEQGRSSAGE